MKNSGIILGILLITFFSCKKETAQIHEKQTEDSATLISDTLAAPVQDSIDLVAEKKLDKFGFPPEVEGCSCYFAENKSDFQKQQFVYVDDYGNNAYIKLNGKLVKIPMEEGDFDPSNFSKTIENAEYKVEMNGKKIKEMDETMMFEGKMTVENKKTGEKITAPIYGECGC